MTDLFHLAPRRENVVTQLAVHNLATVLVELGLLRRPALGLGRALGDEGNGPVHEVEVEVFCQSALRYRHTHQGRGS